MKMSPWATRSIFQYLPPRSRFLILELLSLKSNEHTKTEMTINLALKTTSITIPIIIMMASTKYPSGLDGPTGSVGPHSWTSWSHNFKIDRSKIGGDELKPQHNFIFIRSTLFTDDGDYTAKKDLDALSKIYKVRTKQKRDKIYIIIKFILICM